MWTWKRLHRQLNSYLDSYCLLPTKRWLVALGLFLVLAYRITVHEYIGVMYFFCLYVLYLLVQFYTPMGLPDPDEDDPNQVVGKSASNTDIPYTMRGDDQPALRSLTEFNLWKKVMVALLVALLVALPCTFFAVFLIPVYWPFLLGYFVLLVGSSVRKHYKHMQKYGYSLGDFGRKRHYRS